MYYYTHGPQSHLRAGGAPPSASFSEGGTIRLETLIELTFLNSSFSNSNLYQFDLFELILLLKLDKQFPVGQFEATVSQSAVPPPSLISISLFAASLKGRVWPDKYGIHKHALKRKRISKHTITKKQAINKYNKHEHRQQQT